MKVLSLVTTERASFYQKQVELLRQSGIEVTTISPPNPTDGGTRSVTDYLGLYPELLRRSFGSYDLVHANYGLTAPLALAQPKLPVVLSLWGSDLLGKYGSVSRFCARYCDAVVVMSEEMADALDQDCFVIPHGVDLDQFAPQSQREAQEVVGWDPRAYHVLFPYNPDRPVKDYPRAERVVAAVDDRFERPVVLHAVTGVDHEEVPTYMNAADSLLVTSTSEGSPNTIKEALACNVPIVSTDVGDVAERLRGVTPSAVCRTDDELTDELAAVLEADTRSNGRGAVEELSAQHATDQLRSIFESTVSDRATPQANPYTA
ncbi:glycosyltransferase [Halomarina salina]|uniref:Glycosyltransferase n=1 Tax=Halomarina salina TaxID=1872699 RepID=A0ABD5RHU4_9EURY|nr:glycosyltransferase [Halomarina salina]